MNNRREPHISPVTISGFDRFRLTFWTADGTRKRQHFSTRQEAEDRIRQLEKDRVRYGEAAEVMSAQLRSDAIFAAGLLKETGKTLTEAARHLLAALKKEQDGKPLTEAADLFVKSRDRRADAYRAVLKKRMDLFASHFQGRTTTSLEVEDVQSFLDALAARDSAGTVRHYRTMLSMFFRFCSARKWCTGNPAALTSKVEVRHDEAQILTPVQAAKLLQACDPAILPGVALQLFCGVRAAEMQKLDWSALKRHETQVQEPAPAPTKGRKTARAPKTVTVTKVEYTLTVGAGVAKTNSRRSVPVPDACVQWILPHIKSEGSIWPVERERARDLWTLARVQAGFGPERKPKHPPRKTFFTDSPLVRAAQLDPKTGKERTDLVPWPANGLRHSAISYRLAQTADLPRVAYEAGNSPKVVQAHYNGLATAQDAAKFYAVVPVVPSKVTRLRAVA
jgi:hypothetical protein